MNSQEVTPVPLCIAETISDEIEQMYDEITRRAYEIFQQRGGNSTLDLEDWLTAERELLSKPNVRVEEKKGQIVVTVYLGKISLQELHILITPHAMLVHAPSSTGMKKLFRAIQFPLRIDVTKAEASYGEGCLILTA